MNQNRIPEIKTHSVIELERYEVQSLLEALWQVYGIDFRNYALSSIKRRIIHRVREEELNSITGLQEKILHNHDCLKRLVKDFSIHVTAMFRDPRFYSQLREEVFPVLKTYPIIRIWNAGCSSGEEVYSLAILALEEEVYERCRIYATDMDEAVILQAQAGTYPAGKIEEYTANYLQAGGTRSLTDYCTVEDQSMVMHPRLKRNIIFARHNLATDGSFNEFNLILCRNILIYFNQTLREKVHELLYTSLCMFGFLGLGSKESLQCAGGEEWYEPVDSKNRIYRKI